LLAWKPITKPQQFESDHIDDNPSNNSLDNLQWLNNSRNVKKAQQKRRRRIRAVSSDGMQQIFSHTKKAIRFFSVPSTTLRRIIDREGSVIHNSTTWNLSWLDPSQVPPPIFDHRDELYSVIPNFDKYEASRDGLIRNRETRRILRSTSIGDYMALKLSISDGVSKHMFVHRLIAATFVPNLDPFVSIEVNHIDGDPRNNGASNLEWCSRRQNQLHSIYELGGLGTCAQIDEFGSVIQIWESHAEAARELGLCDSGINMVLRGKQNNVKGYRFMYINN